jgi:hypothetical protein
MAAKVFFLTEIYNCTNIDNIKDIGISWDHKLNNRNYRIFIILFVVLAVSVSCSSKLSSSPSPKTQTLISNQPLTPATGSSSTPASLPVSDAKFSVSLDKQSIKAGDAFSAEISVDTRTLCRGTQWNLSFQAKDMRCDGFSEGNFFKDWAAANDGTTIVFPQPNIDNTNGIISETGIGVMAQKAGGATGRGVLCSYHFTALTDGVTAPLLFNILLADENGKIFQVK